MKTPMQKAASLAVELRQRINPAYSTQRGTESYERRECAEMIEALLFEIDRLTKQCNDYAQEAYKTRVEAETLEQHYKCEIDALRTLLRGLNPYLRRSELPKELYEIILAEMKWEQT